MSLRLVEITVEADSLDEMTSLVREGEHTDLWAVEEGPERAVVRVLVPMSKTEELTDRLRDRFGEEDCFRIVLIAVEATVPPVEEEGDEEEEGEEKKKRTPRRVSREEVYHALAEASRLDSVYFATVALSTVVAAVGLIRNDVAVIVGAMVIAPLLGPNVALSLAATLGDPSLARKAAASASSGASVALAVALLFGLFAPFDPETTELARRSVVGLADVALALAAGSAGVLAYTTGLPTAVVGVMVAVALLPPLVAVGLYAGAALWGAAAGAALLTLTNVTAVNLAGVVTFLLQRVQPRTWWEEERAKKATRIAIAVWVLLLLLLVALIVGAAGDGSLFGG